MRHYGLRLLAILVLLVLLAGPASAQNAPGAQPPAAKLEVLLLGTGGGPPINLERYGPSTLIIAGDDILLFDCGRGATLRLAEAGVPLTKITKVFLTHLHSDHIVQLPDLFLSPWTFARSPGGPRTVPLEIWGPSGTREMMKNLQRAFAFDIHVRRDIDERFSPDGIKVVSHDIEQGTVYNRNGVKVTAFLVEHGPVKPAFGYRIDFAGHSVVLSGDTRPSENVVRFSRGVDVLIHEVVDPAIWQAALNNPQTRASAEKVIAHHTSPRQAGELFSRIKPRLAVYSHATITPRLVPETRKTYNGPLEIGEDLMRIEIGSTIEIHRQRK